MKIAIDLRSLQSGGISGVENYILNVVQRLLPMDAKNSYSLFFNSSRPIDADMERLRFINSTVVNRRIPNKLLNMSLLALHRPRFDRLIGEFDVLWLPNINHFALRTHAKLAITVHDLSPVITPEHYDMRRRLWHSLLGFKKTVSRADIIFAVSEHTKGDLMRLCNVPEQKIRVVYPGLDTTAFNDVHNKIELRRARNTYGLPKDFTLFLSTIEPRKNLLGVVEAFERLSLPGYLVIAGKAGWKYRPILRRIEASPKRRKIKLLGYVAEHDKAALYALAQAVVYPSFYEGFGFVPLESMSVGTPVITSSVTSLPEVVGDGALMVNPYTIDDIAQAMHAVLTDTALRQTLIEQGKRRARQFRWETAAKKILEGFESLD